MDVKTEESVTTCAHHAKVMDIALWSGLPEELQELVFARLPWPQIYRVRILSKGWNQKLVSGAKDLQLTRACARAQPKSFALLTYGDDPGSFTVNMFDIASNRWHSFETSLGYDPKCDEIDIEAICASDGGLVCFLSKGQSTLKNPIWLVFVCNPLTRVSKQLPPLSGIVQRHIMVQLIMDRETKHYRVVVVGYCKDPKVGNLVEVYHSETGQWTKADGSYAGEVVHGYFYKSESKIFTHAPYSYSFADGLVHKIGFNTPGNSGLHLVLGKDHLFFVTVVEPYALRTHCIEEYQAVQFGASWTFLKEYPFTRLPSSPHLQPEKFDWFPFFFACKDFLLLFVLNEEGEENLREFLFIYEFSGEEWRELPMMPGGYDSFLAQMHMCELRLDSVP